MFVIKIEVCLLSFQLLLSVVNTPQELGRNVSSIEPAFSLPLSEMVRCSGSSKLVERESKVQVID